VDDTKKKGCRQNKAEIIDVLPTPLISAWRESGALLLAAIFAPEQAHTLIPNAS